MPENKKKCPYCAGLIESGAIKCKHCGKVIEKRPAGQVETADLRLDDSPTAADRMLAGRYRVIEEVGRGGMGVVYLAHDEELDMDVAIKLLPFELANDSRSLDLLRSEAKLSMSLSHPNIVRLHTLDTSGRFNFLVMEYVDGPTLRYVLQKKGRLTLGKALPVIRAICGGVGYAHSQRVLHRDLKPANIMLTSKGVVKIADFGIAQQMRESMSMLSQKIVAGTPCYMAPEHLMGEHLTVRSEVYSIAALTYQIFAGHPPFYKGDIPTQVRFKEPAPVAGIPKPVSDVILKALSKDPSGRPGSAKDFYESLRAATLRIKSDVAPTEEMSPPLPAPKPPPPAVPKKEQASTQALRSVGLKKDLRESPGADAPVMPKPPPSPKPEKIVKAPLRPEPGTAPKFSPPRRFVPPDSRDYYAPTPKRAARIKPEERPAWVIPAKVSAFICVYFWVSVLAYQLSSELCLFIIRKLKDVSAYSAVPSWIISTTGLVISFGFAGLAAALVTGRAIKLLRIHWGTLIGIIAGVGIACSVAVVVIIKAFM